MGDDQAQRGDMETRSLPSVSIPILSHLAPCSVLLTVTPMRCLRYKKGIAHAQRIGRLLRIYEPTKLGYKSYRKRLARRQSRMAERAAQLVSDA